MRDLNILICEGNLIEESKKFKKAGIQTHTESLMDSISCYANNVNIDVLNPSSELDLKKIIPNLKKYDGLVWGGSSLNIYNDTPEIKRQIFFMKECFKNVKKILAICWGMQLAVTAAGGEVKKAIKGSHIGIANDIEITKGGLNNLLYKDKKNFFSTPAFNFDEVVTVPYGAIHLASNKINKIQGLNFKAGVSEIWGLQYHPEITYKKMVDIIRFRKETLISKMNRFKDEVELNAHISFIEKENKISEPYSRMTELKNWLNLIN